MNVNTYLADQYLDSMASRENEMFILELDCVAKMSEVIKLSENMPKYCDGLLGEVLHVYKEEVEPKYGKHALNSILHVGEVYQYHIEDSELFDSPTYGSSFIEYKGEKFTTENVIDSLMWNEYSFKELTIFANALRKLSKS